jgi:hypothetical protein
MGIRGRPERKTPQDTRREKITKIRQAVICAVFEAFNSLARVEEGRLYSLGKRKANDGTATDFALNAGGAAVKIDDRLYQSQAQACSIRSAR